MPAKIQPVEKFLMPSGNDRDKDVTRQAFLRWQTV
jgi:hypothetical protein